jgi:hypothetical protein
MFDPPPASEVIIMEIKLKIQDSWIMKSIENVVLKEDFSLGLIIRDPYGGKFALQFCMKDSKDFWEAFIIKTK